MQFCGPKETITNMLIAFHNRALLAKSNKELDELLTQMVANLIDLSKWRDRLLSEKEISALYPCFTPRALSHRRARGDGPRYHKFGEDRKSPVFYKVGDVEDWIDAHLVQ